jgi:endonuclease/exonuclease/phosphatase family metal-dependent hydrolase
VLGTLCILRCALCISLTQIACATAPRPQAAPEPALSPDLVIVTWNLHAGAGNLRQLLDDLRADRLTGGATVGDFVLLLQEAAPDILDFARTRGLSAYFEPVHPTRGNAIVSTLALSDARTIELPRERQRRVAVVAAVQLKNTTLKVASTHFENRVSWWRGGLFSEGARLRQAEALIAALPPDDPVAVGGDFNAWLGRDEPAWRALAARFPDGPPPPVQPTFRQRLFLDELFFDLPQGWQVHRSIIDNRYQSDHHAVLGLLYLPR